LVATFEKHYKDLRPTGYQPGYRDYMNGIIGNGCAVDMETATKNHLTLNFYKWCSKYIQKIYPKLSKGEVYDIMKGIYEEKYSGSNKIVLDFRKLLGDQAPTNPVIEKNPTNVLKVYKDKLRYYKEFEEYWAGDDDVSSKDARKEDKNVLAEEGDATVQEVFEIYQNTTSKHVEGRMT
jgi:hypothetical protein